MPFLSSSGISALNIIRGGAAGEASTLLLDLYPNANAAYSLRKLKTAYTGAAIEVRVDTTGQPTYDIGFDSNGDLDTADLLSKAGANDAYVKTWYDQSGNGNDATQTTSTYQPIIVSSGVIETYLSKPCLSISNDFLQTGLYQQTSSGDLSSFIAGSFNGNGVVVGNDTGTRIWRHRAVPSLSKFQAQKIAGGSVLDDVPYNSGASLLSTAIFNSSKIEIFNNSTTNGSTASISLNTTNGSLGLFARSAGSEAATGSVFEIIVYPSDQSSNQTNIESNINARYNIYWDGSQTGLLDDYPGASAAYSLIALNSAYTDPLVKVRRSSDNAEQDIYALYDGTLDTEGLLSFTGAGDGFISAWYDQSGSANNIIQSAAADQPQIVSSGSLITDGDGIIAPSYDGVNDDMLLPGTPFAFSTDSMSLFMVAKALGNNQNAFNLADTNDYFAATYGRSTAGQLVVGYYEDSGLVNESIEGTAGVDKHLLSTIFTRSTTSLAGWINGSAMTNPATGLLRANFNTNVIGSRGGAYELNGTIQLMVIYDSDQTANRSDIETIINNYYSIYP